MPDRTDEFNPADDDDEHQPSPLGAAMPIPAGDSPSAKAGRTKKKRRIPGKTWVIVLVVAIVVLALAPAIASGLKKTPKNRIGISYGGGPIEGSHFQRVIEPGHALFFNGLYDPLYLYPSDQQSYIISKKKDEGSTNYEDSIIAPTRDRVQVEYQIATYFKLHTDRLRAFHEQIGLKYSAYTGDGWRTMINSTFRQQIENALQQETRRHDVADIYGNADVVSQLQDDVQASITERLEAALGEQFFCGPTFVPGGECEPITFIIKKVDLPDSVVASFEKQRNAQIGIETEQSNTARRQEEARGVAALEGAGVSGSDYVLLKAIEAGSINFWVLPQDGGVALQTPAGSAAEATPDGGGSGSGGSTTTTTTTTGGDGGGGG